MDDETVDQVRFQLPVALGQRYGTHLRELKTRRLPRLGLVYKLQLTFKPADASQCQFSNPPDWLVPYKTHLGRSSHRRTTAKFRSMTFLQRDFVLIVQAEGLDTPRCFAEQDLRGSETIAMQLTIIPKFKLPQFQLRNLYLLLIEAAAWQALESRQRNAP